MTERKPPAKAVPYPEKWLLNKEEKAKLAEQAENALSSFSSHYKKSEDSE